MLDWNLFKISLGLLNSYLVAKDKYIFYNQVSYIFPNKTI